MRFTKPFVVAVLGLCIAFQAAAAGALRTQNTGSANGVADVTTTLTGVQAGDLLTVCIYERDGAAISAVGDSVNGSWTLVATRAAIAARIGLYYFVNSGAGNPLVTVTLAGTSPRDINAAAWSGMATSSVLDTNNNAGNSATTSHTHGSVTPSAPSVLLTCAGLGNDHGGMTPNSGFTALNTDGGVANAGRRYYAYKLTHTGALNATHTSTNSQSSDAVVGAFLEAAAGSSGLLRRRRGN